MKRKDIAELLNSIQLDIEGPGEQVRNNAINQLFNAVESSVAQIEQLTAENQTLKDQINRLKGEQGQPEIKPQKNDGDISSEAERLQAEETDEDRANKEGFKLDKGCLEKLKEQRLSIELLDELEKIKGNKFSDEAAFIKEIESTTGATLTTEQHSLLIKYARYRKRKRKAKLPQITIDREVSCAVDVSELPDDAVSKGYEPKVVQDVIIKTDNVKFQREVYYSPSLKKRFIAPVPLGYEGEFGPHIKSNIIAMKYVNGMTIPKLVEFYQNIGTRISSTYINNQLTISDNMEKFNHEKIDLHKAGLEASSYTQIDDTGTRVNGQNHYTQIICTDLYTVFFTTKNKSRLTILDMLRNFESRLFLLNNKTFSLLEQFKLAKKDRQLLTQFQQATPYSEDEMLEILQTLYGAKNPRKRTRILEACAISHYRQETGIMVVKILVCDDAPQFKLLTDFLALCWIHEGRHYKRLNPVALIHQEKVDKFLQEFWAYYRTLVIYKKEPCEQQTEILSTEFDRLFSTKTGYDDLDERIERSKNKKDELLVVLEHPEIPLHNNLSEGGARSEKRRQDVSLQTKTEKGTKAKDTMMSIVETCKKLGISAYRFIYDRVSGQNKMPSLADMVKAKAEGTFISPE